MTKQETLDAVYGALVEIRAKHPHGLRAIGDANCHHVLTRFGVPGQVAELCSITLEVLQEHGGMRKMLEALQRCERLLRAREHADFWNDEIGALLPVARAAIAKAEGR